MPVRVSTFSEVQQSAHARVLATRLDDEPLRCDVAAVSSTGMEGRVAIGQRYLYWAQRGRETPLVVTALGASVLIAALVAPRSMRGWLLIAGVPMAGIGATILAAWYLRGGVTRVPLERVAPVLISGHVWARDGGALLDLTPVTADGADQITEALAADRSLEPVAAGMEPLPGFAPVAPLPQPPEASRRPPRDVVPLLTRIAGGVALAVCVIALLTVIRPQLLFGTSLPAGGDMGSHHYIPQQIRGFLPGALTGWSDGWFAGFPMGHFYFPLPYVVINLLQTILGYGLAFRFVSLAGIFGFPFACYFACKWMDMPSPAPVFGATGGFAFVVAETYSILGGNIASTMAGEFPFSISLTLSVFLIGLMWRGTRTGKGITACACVAACLALSHIVPLILVAVAGAVMVAGRVRGIGRYVGFMATSAGLGFLISAVWLVPFVLRKSYTAHTKWVGDWKQDYLLGRGVCTGGCHSSRTFVVFLIAAAIGLGIAVIYRHAAPVMLAVVASIMALGGDRWPQGELLDTRFLPFYYVCIFLLGAYGLGMTARILVVEVGRAEVALPALAVVLAGVVVIGANSEVRFIRGWVGYNYSGYQVKEGYTEYQALMDTLKTLPRGRVLWEYNGDYERFGTTRSLELVPYWTDHPSMEGLLVESSITSPFHFIMQNETSNTGTGAVPGLIYPSFDLKRGLAHARLFDIRWYVTFTKAAKDAAATNSLKRIASSGQFEIFELDRPGAVSIPPIMPIVASDRDWYTGGLDWFCYSDLARLVVFPQDGEGPMLRSMPHLDARPAPTTKTNIGFNNKRCGRDDHALNDDLLRLPPGDPVPTGEVTTLRNSDGVIEFETTSPGLPHIVSTSWFPTWKAQGAEGPYLVSPSLMMVIPTSNRVVLTEGRRGVDWLAVLMTFMGVGLTVLVAFFQRRRGRLLFAPRPPAVRPATAPPATPRSVPHMEREMSYGP